MSRKTVAPLEVRMPPERVAARRRHLVETIRHGAQPRRAPLRRPVVWAVAIACTIALAAAAYVTTRPTSNPFTVGCYAALDRDAGTTVVAFKGSGTSSATALCAREWARQGETVPKNLVACVVPEGGLGVFPNRAGADAEQACGSIGASVPDVGTPYGGLSPTQVRALDADIAASYEAIRGDARCVDAAQVRAVVSDELVQRDADWAIDDVTSASGRDCATFAVDALGATVLVMDAVR